MGSVKADVSAILTRLRCDHGCEVTMPKSGHWRVCRPGHGTITVSATPSGQHVLKTIRADIRRNLGIRL